MGTSSLEDLYTLDPVEFERLVGTVFSALGYEVRVTKRSGDEGIDLELHRGDELSIAQCKRYRGTVGQPALRDFYGAVIHEKAARGYFVTTGQFSLAASTWAQGKQLALTDGVDLLSALENSGLAPAPRAKARLGAAKKSPQLEKTVRAALKSPAVGGRILLDGAPPEGHSYDEVAHYLERCFPQQTDSAQSVRLKAPAGGVTDWGASNARIRLLDEFDALPRAAMEEVLEWQQTGVRGQGFAPPHSFVLIATVWEKRLPKAVRARFSTVMPSHELDWSIIARASADRRLEREERELRELQEGKERKQRELQLRRIVRRRRRTRPGL